MKRLFNIQANNTPQSDTLLVEVAHYHACLARASKENKTISSIDYFEFDEPLTGSEINKAFEKAGLQIANFENVVVSSAFPEVEVVPASLFDENNYTNFLNFPYPTRGDAVFFEAVKGKEVVLVYAVSKGIMDNLKSSKKSTTTHAVACTLQQIDETLADVIAVNFTGKEFSVVAQKNRQLQLVQTYHYAAPLDVVYYLLAICKEYNLSQSEVVLQLSGLIDENSALYKELHQYFSNIIFAAPATNAITTADYPQHFFSSIYNLAACVL